MYEYIHTIPVVELVTPLYKVLDNVRQVTVSACDCSLSRYPCAGIEGCSKISCETKYFDYYKK